MYLTGISKLGTTLYNPTNILTILAYHGIVDKDSEYKYNDGCVSCGVDAFDRQMRYVQKHYNVINFRILKDYIHGTKSINKPLLIITFDDGYANNHFNAFPILKKYGLTAVVYLVTDYVNTNKLFWFDELYYYFKCTKKDELDLRVYGGKKWYCSNKNTMNETVVSVSAFVNTLEEGKRNKVMNSIKEQLDVSTPKDIEDVRPLTWDEVREMNNYGIELGSHSATHPILSNINEDQLLREIILSKRTIEETIKKRVLSFSIPNGQEGDYTDREIVKIKKAGYSYSVNYIHKNNNLSRINDYDLYRLHIEQEHCIDRFIFGLKFPQIL